MKTLWLVTWLFSGAIVNEPITEAQCAEVVSLAREALAEGTTISRNGEGIGRLACDAHDIVLALPPSEGICDMEPST